MTSPVAATKKPRKAPAVVAEAPPVVQLPLLPERPLVLGELSHVTLDNLPPDAELEGPAPSPALIESIRRWGVLEPALVRAVGGGLDTRNAATLVAGRRRIKAVRLLHAEYRAKVAKLAASVPTDTLLSDETVPGYRAAYERLAAFTRVPVRSISDPEGTLLDGRTEALLVAANAVRADNPQADFRALALLLHRFAGEGLAGKECLAKVASVTGLASGTVKQRLRLLDLSAELRDDFLAGRMGYTVALHASRLGQESQATFATLLDQGEPATLDLVKAAKRESVKEHQAGLFDGLPGGAGGEPESRITHHAGTLLDRARGLIEQLRGIKMPILQDAASCMADLVVALEMAEAEGESDG